MGKVGRLHPRLVRRTALRRLGCEDGAIAIMALGTILVLCGFCGLALDLSRVYNRKMELQSAANAAALAAAIELDGTKAGITKAVQKVSALFATPVMYGGPSYSYHQASMNWSDEAIKFASTPSGPWVAKDIAASKGEPNGLLYVQVNTRGLDPSYGEIKTWFMPIISSELANVSTGALAVAGPSAIAVTPLALCAMRAEAKRNRNGELEEYGFRRGVAYDLMQLNPDAADAGQSFLIHPFAAPGAMGTSASDFNTVAPAVCTGMMGIARLTGGKFLYPPRFRLPTSTDN